MKFNQKSILFLLLFSTIHAQHLDLVNNRLTGEHSGNLIRTRLTNYGILGHRFEKPSMEWPKGSGIEYGLEFAMFAGARIIDEAVNQYYIFTESYSDPYNLDENPTGEYTYSWEPLPGYSNTLLPEGQQTMAMSNIIESWPRTWINDYPGLPGSRDGLWNGEFKAAPICDQESYYVMVDWNNTESPYYPFEEDTTKRGLGLQVKVRNYQWADPLAEDILISIYDITNVSNRTIWNTVFGMYVDADVGGPLNDVMSFDPTGDINITYQWDKASGETGYFGFAFLESPGINSDGIDNDDDGLYDESRASGIGDWIENDASPFMIAKYGQPKSHWSGDEDGDWDPRFHDTGSDGLLPGEENYPGPDLDGTEGNNLPDDGEPNFDRTDLDESDQIGLTSFSAATVNKLKLKEDKTLSERTIPGIFTSAGDRWTSPVSSKSKIDLGSNAEFVYGSGYFPLKPGQTERFSVATIFGHTEKDILGNKNIMQRIYDDNYRFARPPIKPTLTAYATDGQVVLTWDEIAETSYDEIYGEDFEGYILYKATDPEFNEIKTITDDLGNPFYYEALAQFDLRNGIKGPHPVAAGANISGIVDQNGILIEKDVKYPGNGALFYMGDDTGLQHHYVDTELQNGRTYYYAVVAYDKGYDFDFYEKGWSDRNPVDGFKPIYPVQNSKTITQDVVGNIIFHDRNTAFITPNAPSAGTELANLESAIEKNGPATGSAQIIIAYPDSLKPGRQYHITFTDSLLNRVTHKYQIWDETANRLIKEAVYPEMPTEKSLLIGSVIKKNIPRIEAGIFDGLILILNNSPTSKYHTNWLQFKGMLNVNSDTTLYGSFKTEAQPAEGEYHHEDEVYIDNFITIKEPDYPSTYQITFHDTIVDTTFSLSKKYQFPIYFKAIDMDEKDALKVLAKDSLHHGTISHGTTIVLLKRIENKLCAVCEVSFYDENDHPGDILMLPKPNSVLQVGPGTKNLTSRDNFRFKVKSAEFEKEKAKQQLDQIAVVPDPYIASASWEKPLYFTSGRGERRVDFIHLPPQCKIRIFTIDGKLVRTLEHDSPIEDGHHSWDLTSRDGLDVAPGIYLYHVDAPGIGEHMGRFALIK